MPHASIVGLGPLAIPAIVAGKTMLNFGDIFRCASHYQVRPFEIPLALGLSVWTHIMEIPGMWTAYRRRQIRQTAYR
jgi:hypothetical protein